MGDVGIKGTKNVRNGDEGLEGRVSCSKATRGKEETVSMAKFPEHKHAQFGFSGSGRPYKFTEKVFLEQLPLTIILQNYNNNNSNLLNSFLLYNNPKI